ncbi:hypothetical protein FRC12_022186 [Ceratobasidium sp. 428]|nr:hypothetical protein FRC12_022186 [Ceratobasidium sp. 428]
MNEGNNLSNDYEWDGWRRADAIRIQVTGRPLAATRQPSVTGHRRRDDGRWVMVTMVTEEARQELKKLRQKGTVQDYLTEFQRLSAYLGYNDITLCDMFYDHLSMEVKHSMLAQSFDPAGTTTFNELAERALLIDKHIQQFAKTEKPKNNPSPSTSTAKTTTTTTTQTTTAKTLLSKGDRVFTIGTDGRATRGQVTKIAKNAKGFNAPWVKWDGQNDEVKMTFDSLKKDTRPAPTPGTSKGPGPMDLDSAGKGKSVITCNRCQGKGHMAKDCPSKPMSGYEASVEKVDSEEEESEKDDA